MIKLTLNIIFFLITVGIYSQTNIYGTVTDQGSSEVIPFALVELKYNDTVHKDQADFDGRFHFNNVESERLHLSVKSMGYFNYDSVLFVGSNDSLMLSVELINDPTVEYEVILSEYNKKGALKDIKKGEIKLLLPGGIITAAELPNDSIFEEKYNLTFVSQGCVRYPGENEYEYNTEIFKYLDKKYGSEWRDEVRKDVIGLKKR